MKHYPILFFVCFIFISETVHAQAKRIITLSTALSEVTYALGAGSKIVAVDVTSEYPQEINKKPRVSKDRNVSLEGLLSFRPDLVLAPPAELSMAVETKLKKLGVRVVIIQQEYSVKGAQRFIREVATAIGEPQAGVQLANKVNAELGKAMVKLNGASKKPKVLFVYAQGVGLMSVAGKGSHIEAIISLAGGRNAVQEFNDFKPYSTESLIQTNPDIILLFDFGASSLGGKQGILRMPGVSLTNAGKTGRIISMNGPLLINFANRLPQAITELNKLLYP